ncbi:MAG TPA: diguanylate cyclase [Terracidiphilus sp.]|nr:diguanylate cyclase [Terracidiphilus sp.]
MSLTTVRAVRSLSRAEAEQNYPATVEGTVTFYRGSRRNLFVQDGDTGVFVKTAATENLAPGDRVRITGKTGWGYRPNVQSDEIAVVGHSALPKPVPASFDKLIRGELDGIRVTVRGVLHSADLDLPSAAHVPSATLRVLIDGGYVEAEVLSGDAKALEQFLDSEVEITGVASGKFDGKYQLTGIALHVNSLADIKVLKPAAVNPWSLPFMPMDEVLGVYHVKNRTGRVRVSGTVTYFEPGSALVLENGEKSLWIKTSSYAPIRIGDWAEAIGFPGVSNGFLALNGSEIRDTGVSSPVAPVPATWQQFATSNHVFDLVSIEGRVVMQARESSQDEYVLVTDGHVFSAIYPHRNAVWGLLPLKRIPVGAQIRVTGICATDKANRMGADVPFNILLRSAGDLEVLSKPSLLTVRNLGIMVVALLLGILAVGARALFLDRAMRSKLAELGYLGQRRSEILEDINKSKPLSETLERITELASASLKGAPCWCQITDGGRLGNRPSQSGTSGLRIAEHPIAAHSGPALGAIFAAFDARATSLSDEDKALATAAELATLAIETSRLHSDLVHRSEFDMLTEIENRFSFEKHLDNLFEEARGTSGVFGIIYIDLNDFKKVNDLYGHQFGDIYLQNVAARMKHQLRPGDLLARLGGDEFGVLLPAVRDQVDVEEITSRLEHCFETPFVMGSHTWRGSASFGTALYPKDADTKDSLLSSADAAMYAAKHGRRQLR